MRAASIEPRAPTWRVADTLKADTLACVFGDPGSGKTFWALDLACCVATGTAFPGRAVQRGAVVLVAGEAHAGLAAV